MKKSSLSEILSDQTRLDAHAQAARDAMVARRDQQAPELSRPPSWAWALAALLIALFFWISQPAAIQETENDEGETIHTLLPQHQVPASAGETVAPVETLSE